MDKVLVMVFVAALATKVSAKEITKENFLKDGKSKITKQLCNSKKFLSCTGHSESLCKAQMKVIILPHCIQTKLGELPKQLAPQEANQAATVFAKCAAISYAAFSQLEMDKFGLCMAE